MNAVIRRFVEQRARSRCEYCQLHKEDAGFFSFHVERIIAQQHGGTYRLPNLCFSCPACNAAKGPNLAGIWKGKIVPLFNPRRQPWNRHFHWDGLLLVGRTIAGNVTARLLGINDRDRVRLRASLFAEGRFPPLEDLPD